MQYIFQLGYAINLIFSLDICYGCSNAIMIGGRTKTNLKRNTKADIIFLEL